MIFAPVINSFFCQSIPKHTKSLDVTFDRIDALVKAAWPTDSTRPVPVLGMSSSGTKVVKEFCDADSCKAEEFKLLGSASEFAIYLDWDHYLAEKPIEHVD